MSTSGIQKAAQCLGTLNNLLPVIAEADAEGLDVAKLLIGSLARMGISCPELIAAVVGIVGPPDRPPA